MKKEVEEFDSTSDTVIIRPDLVVFKSPVEISFTESYLNVRNLWTFFSFKRLSKRIARRLHRSVGILVRRFLDNVGYRDVEAHVSLEFDAKTSNFVVSFGNEEILDRKLAMNLTKYAFSSMCFRLPEYSIREYRLLPISEGDYKFFIVLTPYRRDLSRTLDVLKDILKYPYVTLPNDEGTYFLSGFGEDNLNEPPRIIDKLASLMHLREIFFAKKLSDLYSQITSPNRPNNYSEPIMARAIKELVDLMDYFEDPKPIYRLLQFMHKVFGVERPTKEDLLAIINLLDDMTKKCEGLDALKKLYKYFRSLYDEFLLIERIEELGIIRAALRKLSKMVCVSSKEKIDIRGIPAFLHEFVLAGSILAKYRKELINLGGGKAIYISPHEWRCISRELSIAEKAKLEIKIVKHPDGRKYLVISFLND